MTTYSLAEICNGTGWPKGIRFAIAEGDLVADHDERADDDIREDESENDHGHGE